MQKENIIEFLLTSGFNALTYEQKNQIKLNRPTPHLLLTCQDGKYIRTFQKNWYNKLPWLTGCDKRNKVFCFTCVIFGGEKEWSVNGLSSIKNFLRKSEKHAISQKHLTNQEKCHLLGKVRIEHAISEGRRLAAVKHNEQVGINRRLIARMIHVVYFLGKQELAFRGHRENNESLNKGNHYYSRAASTIKKHFLDLKNAVLHVTEEPGWDPISVCTASGLYDKLNDANFVYFLILFSKVFLYIDHVFNFLQSKSLSNIKSCISEIQNLKKNLSDLRNDTNVNNCCDEAILLNNNLEYEDKKRNKLCKITYEILDSLIVQINIRFEDFPKLEFVEIVNEKMFKSYYSEFPESKFIKLLQQYPNTFDADRLCNELAVIYADDRKHLPPHELLDFIVNIGDLHQDIYPQVTKLCQLVLTIPSTTASSERSMSTLKRIKTFLRNTMTNERLSSLSSLAIEKNLLGDMAKDPT
ncbi:hypothetical protein QTP88_009937 [Uroleucon formosanum]